MLQRLQKQQVQRENRFVEKLLSAVFLRKKQVSNKQRMIIFYVDFLDDLF